MSKYKFDWSKFPEAEFYANATRHTEGRLFPYNFLGSVRVGELCFDLNTRENLYASGHPVLLFFDLYAGGVPEEDWQGPIDPETGTNSPYAYSRIEPDFPYEYAEGDDFKEDVFSVPYSMFKQMAENLFTDYIDHGEYTGVYDLPKLAAMPLHIW